MSFQSNLNDPVPPSPSAERMKRCFDQARRKTEAEAFHSPEQWRQVQEIERKAERLRQLSESRYKDQHDELVAREIKRLLAERYSPQRNHTPRGVATPNDLTRQAQANVRKRQEERKSWIDRAEKNQRDRVQQQPRQNIFRDHSFERPDRAQQSIELKREFRKRH